MAIFLALLGLVRFPGSLSCIMKAGRRVQLLARSGISLVVLGHLTLVLGAIIHGSLLYHVAWPAHTITSEYTMANVIAVASGHLSIAAGVLAVLVSRNFSHRCLPWILVVISLANVLISGACCMGLALAISLTVVNGGCHLFTGCNSSALPADAHTVITNECPFDTTHIYDTALVLWLPSLLMAAVEAGLSAWCCTASLFVELGPLQPPTKWLSKYQLENERRIDYLRKRSTSNKWQDAELLVLVLRTARKTCLLDCLRSRIPGGWSTESLYHLSLRGVVVPEKSAIRGRSPPMLPFRLRERSWQGFFLLPKDARRSELLKQFLCGGSASVSRAFPLAASTRAWRVRSGYARSARARASRAGRLVASSPVPCARKGSAAVAPAPAATAAPSLPRWPAPLRSPLTSCLEGAVHGAHGKGQPESRGLGLPRSKTSQRARARALGFYSQGENLPAAPTASRGRSWWRIGRLLRTWRLGLRGGWTSRMLVLLRAGCRAALFLWIFSNISCRARTALSSSPF
ncbi:uncharacterized protein LOC133365493 [Rhineura floridana]|uniref:uncharacterized protein LOC133365493 n=1 Tax=Rhineura floridana TaxID=261503 RepID=UPI002AC83FA3|nr:uncharacterized protein LOC133365493 [Rhineura floridana]